MQHSIRTNSTGANRDSDAGKLDYDGFLSPFVIEAFASYMNFNRELADGSLRDSDNWQKGMPREWYMKSLWRHFMDVWKWHRGLNVKEGIVWAICACIFNLQGYLHTLLKEQPDLLENAIWAAEERRAIQRRRAKLRSPTPYEPYNARVQNGCTIEAQYGNKDPEADVPHGAKFLTPYPKPGRFP